jgi:hypothetical protein
MLPLSTYPISTAIPLPQDEEGDRQGRGHGRRVKATMVDIMNWSHVLQYFYCNKDE